MNIDTTAGTDADNELMSIDSTSSPALQQARCYGQYGKVEDVCEINRVYHLNFLNNNLPDKCANLIIADPPYFEVKGAFDFVWEDMKAYLLDVEKWARECKRILADNGTLFWYGHARNIAYSQVIFDEYFTLENNLVWRKKDSIQYQYYSPDLARTFNTHNERILLYSNEELKSMIDIRMYLWNEYQKTGLTMEQVNELIGTTSKGGGGMAYNTLSITRTNWDFPKKYIYEALQKTGFFLKNYDDLKNEFEKSRRHFHNALKLEEVLEFSQEAHITKEYDHPTKKPETLTRALIQICSRPNDLVIVPFAGSGTEVAMSVKEGRRAIGYDIESKYVEMSNRRVKAILMKPELFR